MTFVEIRAMNSKLKRAYAIGQTPEIPWQTVTVAIDRLLSMADAMKAAMTEAEDD